MKHIVKFDLASDANNYEIKNVPFLTTVGENNLLLTCTEENKKIEVDGQGNASVIEAGPVVMTLHIGGGVEPETIQYEAGMTWLDWSRSEYHIKKVQVLDWIVRIDGLFLNSDPDDYYSEVRGDELIDSTKTYSWNID